MRPHFLQSALSSQIFIKLTLCFFDDPVDTVDQLLQKSSLLAELKAVKNGNVWCTGKYMYQATDITGDLIMDLHRVLTDDPGEMRFLYKLQ